MNKPALSPILATVCLATMSLGTAAAVETELQLPNKADELSFSTGAELVNKHYDQGVIRNDNATLIGHVDARWFDIGLHGDWYLAADGDNSRDINAGETTQINLGVDYLFELQDVFQIIPHFQFITYPNQVDQPWKDDQQWVGVDSWYILPWPNIEVGSGFDYNPFYNSTEDAYKGGGWLSDHALRAGVASRQFIQNAPLDLAFYEVLNFGNAEYKRFLNGSGETGFTTFDLGLRYITPFFLDQLWMTASVEAHFWLENDDRQALKDAGQNTTEIVMGLGFEWKP
ncbi:MAG TPA: hypothetical protein VHX44_14640 [Planctomycetota bacterium]|nr:hypothetical protein [Planctomycetota bacterium]